MRFCRMRKPFRQWKIHRTVPILQFFNPLIRTFVYGAFGYTSIVAEVSPSSPSISRILLSKIIRSLPSANFFGNRIIPVLSEQNFPEKSSFPARERSIVHSVSLQERISSSPRSLPRAIHEPSSESSLPVSWLPDSRPPLPAPCLHNPSCPPNR